MENFASNLKALRRNLFNVNDVFEKTLKIVSTLLLYRRYAIYLTLVRMALLAPLCRMANTFECPCSASPPADPKLVSEDTNKMSKSLQLIGTT